MGHILVVGSLHMDMVVWTAHPPEPGETIFGSDFATFPGGKGANQAVAAARLGAQVKLIGRVGVDSFGDDLLETAGASGVDCTYVQRDPLKSTGIAAITVTDDGQNSIVVVSGASGRVTAQDVSMAGSAFQEASVVVLQNETTLEANQRAIELAQQYGIPVVLNPAPARPLEPEVLAGIDYLIPNQIELAYLSGVDGVSTAVRLLLDIGVKRLVVTLGEAGCLVAEGEQLEELPAFPVTPLDTTAAGDAFIGAFAVALLEGKGTVAAARWANAAGALATTKAGAQPSLPSRNELETFLEQMGAG